MNRKLLISGIVTVFLLTSFTLPSVTSTKAGGVLSKISIHSESRELCKNNEIFPGDIVDISFSNQYPKLGQPVEIFVTIKGNPGGKVFKETLNISDKYEGIVAKSNSIEWKSGNVTLDKIKISVGRQLSYTKKLVWYPVVVGNHTIKFQAGSSQVKTRNISIGFDTQHIIYPSLGCPTILNRNKSERLTVAISEERHLSEDPISIQKVELEALDGATIYPMTNENVTLSTWIPVGEDMVEDEIVVNYEISDVPCGFYDISVTTLQDMYYWPHAVKIIDEEPKEYRFVHLTDIHIGKTYNLINEKKILEDKIRYINDEIHPDFVVVSGDIVDWCNIGPGRNFWDDLQEVILTCGSPVFTTPGNHERYKNGLYLFYMPFIDLSYYHRFLNPLSDYTFEYGDVNFVLLDSGYDWNRWEIKRDIWNPTPEGSGLTNTQMYLLENEWGNNTMNQIIVMHHPAVNKKDDYGLFFVPDSLPSGNDQCIAFNRKEFINYCNDNNVTIVLTGHTHRNLVLDSYGKIPTHLYEWPLFVQTDSTTLDRMDRGGRIITIENGDVQSYGYSPMI